MGGPWGLRHGEASVLLIAALAAALSIPAYPSFAPTVGQVALARLQSRDAFTYQPELPQWALDRARAVVGDDSRLRAFVEKLVKGAPHATPHTAWR
jgi:hypothetical protein